jgi:hypothetical protein
MNNVLFIALAFVLGVIVGDILKPLTRWGSKN